MINQRDRQAGAVSLFIVIFAALLIITVGTAFIRIVIQGQMQATADDLSKSALDSAYAGVEDAKRAIAEYNTLQCASGTVTDPTATARCGVLSQALIDGYGGAAAGTGWTGCNSTIAAGVASAVTPGSNEVAVKANNNAADDSLNQAYTCVKVKMKPENYITNTTQDTSVVVSLKPEAGQGFDKIRIQWYKIGDTSINVDDLSTGLKLPSVWPLNRPAVMKLQLLQYGPNFRLSDFDSDADFNSTLFLVPSRIGTDIADFGSDKRQDQNNPAFADTTARAARCDPTPTDVYACSMTISLPADWDRNDATADDITTRRAYLKLSQFYASPNTEVSITMINSATPDTPVRFITQPVVDVTGRANDVFRRIQSRVDLDRSTIPTIESAVDVTRSLCKNFIVTDTEWQYQQRPGCPEAPQP